MRLTENFTLEEMTKTNEDLPNTPSEYEIYKLFLLCTYILQPTRDKFGAIFVTSGYRSKEVNAAVGGSKTSQHMKGEAADIVPDLAHLEEVFKWMRENLTFGQLIYENKDGKKWIHVSLPRLEKTNGQVLIFDGYSYVDVTNRR